MSVHIKSEDLCRRCFYSFDRHCQNTECRLCELWREGKACVCVDRSCSCGGVNVNDNTPCPYFREVKDDD